VARGLAVIGDLTQAALPNVYAPALEGCVRGFRGQAEALICRLLPIRAVRILFVKDFGFMKD